MPAGTFPRKNPYTKTEDMRGTSLQGGKNDLEPDESPIRPPATLPVAVQRGRCGAAADFRQARHLDRVAHRQVLAARGVIDLDDAYQLVAVSEPGRDYLWVLSRTPQVPAAAYDALLGRLAAKGFDLKRLERSPSRP